MMFSKAFILDLLERAIATFAQTLLGAGVVLDFTDSRTYVAAGIAAGLAILKGLAATQVGAPDSASLLPADEDPPQDAGHGDLVLLLVIAAGVVAGLLIFAFTGIQLDHS